MTRAGWFSVLSCVLWAGLSSQAAASGSPIATSMGDLRWGMTETELTGFLKRKIQQRYDDQIGKTHDARKQAQLRSDMRRVQGQLQQSLVNFDSGHTSWDRSVVAGEFGYGDGESMLVYKDDASQNYYFFLNGRLWKWYKALDTAAFGSSDFKSFSQSIQKKFGPGREKKGELGKGQGSTQWVEYLDRFSRLRAADNSKRGVFALIFEEMSTVRELAASRGSSRPKRDVSADDEAQPPERNSNSNSNSNSSGRPELAKASPSRRSIFAAEQRGETDAEYEARQKRIVAEDRKQQQNMHSRKEEAKKGEALQPLEGLDDKDPLGGL